MKIQYTVTNLYRIQLVNSFPTVSPNLHSERPNEHHMFPSLSSLVEPGLEPSLGTIHHQDSHVCLRRSRYHVRDKVLVAGIIQQVNSSLGGGEAGLGDVDSDASLTLFARLVETPREREGPFSRFLTVCFVLVYLAFGDVP